MIGEAKVNFTGEFVVIHTLHKIFTVVQAMCYTATSGDFFFFFNWEWYLLSKELFKHFFFFLELVGGGLTANKRCI